MCRNISNKSFHTILLALLDRREWKIDFEKTAHHFSDEPERIVGRHWGPTTEELAPSRVDAQPALVHLAAVHLREATEFLSFNNFQITEENLI